MRQQEKINSIKVSMVFSVKCRFEMRKFRTGQDWIILIHSAEININRQAE